MDESEYTFPWDRIWGFFLSVATVSLPLVVIFLL